MSYVVTYYDYRVGTRSFECANEKELEMNKEWLDAGGYMYSVKEVR